MKNFSKLGFFKACGIIAIVAIIGIGLAGCKTEGNEDRSKEITFTVKNDSTTTITGWRFGYDIKGGMVSGGELVYTPTSGYTSITVEAGATSAALKGTALAKAGYGYIYKFVLEVQYNGGGTATFRGGGEEPKDTYALKTSGNNLIEITD